MNFQESNAKIEAQEKRVSEETQKLLELHRAHEPRKIKDYTLNTANGPKLLSSFFGDKSEMLLIHNMGKKCTYCTLWGDTINGITGHLRDRSALLMVNGDDVATQSDFAKGRAWTFPMASTEKSTLAQDLEFHGEKGDWPGVSVLTKDKDGQLWQKTKAGFGPGDIFAGIWNFIGMLPSNIDWSPKYKY